MRLLDLRPKLPLSLSPVRPRQSRSQRVATELPPSPPRSRVDSTQPSLSPHRVRRLALLSASARPLSLRLVRARPPSHSPSPPLRRPVLTASPSPARTVISHRRRLFHSLSPQPRPLALPSLPRPPQLLWPEGHLAVPQSQPLSSAVSTRRLPCLPPDRETP